MNERMRKLSEQAAKCVCENEPKAFDDTNLFYELMQAKFAELIVKECAQVCADRGKHHDGLYSAWASDCSERIEKHFGVEE